METVTTTGPLFDSRAEIALREGVNAIREHIANDAEERVTSVFSMHIRENTGRFLRSIGQTRESRTYVTGKYTLPVIVEDPATDTVVTTDLATYGPWLEGTGSRNETTRFKGYHGFRLAFQETDRNAKRLAEEAFAPYARRME
jgi:hypothetical protein